MNYLKRFSTCLVALTLTSAAWAEIYETKDAQGNPEFTDSPPSEGAQVIDLPQTNLVEPPPEMPQPQEQSRQAPEQQGRMAENDGGMDEQEGNTVYDDVDDGEYDDAYARARRREALDRATPLDHDAIPEGLHEETPLDPSAPRESLDAEIPHEVGDFNEPRSVINRR